MQPSSFLVGPTKARNSASSRISWPSRARRMTINVTASFGSFPPDDAFLRDFARADFRGFALRFGIVAGIVAQNAHDASHMKASRDSAQARAPFHRLANGRSSSQDPSGKLRPRNDT